MILRISEKIYHTRSFPVNFSDGFKGFQGLSDLHLGDQKVTWKKLVHGSSGNDIISSYPNPSPRKTSKHLLRRHSDAKNIPRTS